MIIFTLSLLNSCTNVGGKSAALKEKIKNGVIDFKKSINNPLKTKQK